MQESHKDINWKKALSFDQWNGQWDLSYLIKAAENTEESIRKHIIRDNPHLSGYTLKELLTLPPEVQYNVDNNKDLDKMINEVVNRLISSGFVEQQAIEQLQKTSGYQNLYQDIKQGNKYATVHELIKGLQDLALAKKLGYDGVDVVYAGAERIDRDITLVFYKTHKNATSIWSKGDRYSRTTTIADEVKNNMNSFTIGSHLGNKEIFKMLLAGGKYEMKNLTGNDAKNYKKIAVYTISTAKLESVVRYLIYNKYGGADYSGEPRFNAPTFFSSNTEVRLLSDMLIELQNDLNQGKGDSDTIIKFFYGLTTKDKLQGRVVYGYRSKK